MGSSYYTFLVTILIFLLGTIFLDISPALGDKTLDDSWTPIKNLSDPHVISVGEFAVTTHNTQAQTTLVFDSLADGQTKNSSGTDYKLVIAAKNGNGDDTLRNYEALVNEKPFQNFMELMYFKGPI